MPESTCEAKVGDIAVIIGVGWVFREFLGFET